MSTSPEENFKARDFFKGVDLGDYSPESLTTVNKIIAHSKASDLELCAEIKRLRKATSAPLMSQDDMSALDGLKSINPGLIEELMIQCDARKKLTEESDEDQG